MNSVLRQKKFSCQATGAADSSASEMYEQCLPVMGKNFSPKFKSFECDELEAAHERAAAPRLTP